MSVDFSKYVKVCNIAKQFDQHQQNNLPVLRLTIDPVHPFNADSTGIYNADFALLGEKLGVDKLELKTLLKYALCSEHGDEVINSAIMKLLVTIKMRLADDNDIVRDEFSKVAYWQRLVEENKADNAKRSAEYERATAVFEARKEVMRTSAAEILNQVVRDAYEAHKTDTKTVWQTLCIDFIKDRRDTNITQFVEKGFDEASMDEMQTFAVSIGQRHKGWFNYQVDDLIDSIRINLWDTVPCEVDADDFLQYFNEDADPHDDAMTAYDEAMSEWDTELLWRARDRAKVIIQQRIAEKIDGYDGPTYSF